MGAQTWVTALLWLATAVGLVALTAHGGEHEWYVEQTESLDGRWRTRTQLSPTRTVTCVENITVDAAPAPAASRVQCFAATDMTAMASHPASQPAREAASRTKQPTASESSPSWGEAVTRAEQNATLTATSVGVAVAFECACWTFVVACIACPFLLCIYVPTAAFAGDEDGGGNDDGFDGYGRGYGYDANRDVLLSFTASATASANAAAAAVAVAAAAATKRREREQRRRRLFSGGGGGGGGGGGDDSGDDDIGARDDSSSGSDGDSESGGAADERAAIVNFVPWREQRAVARVTVGVGAVQLVSVLTSLTAMYEWSVTYMAAALAKFASNEASLREAAAAAAAALTASTVAASAADLTLSSSSSSPSRTTRPCFTRRPCCWRSAACSHSRTS
jgi:hypothetical protein